MLFEDVEVDEEQAAAGDDDEDGEFVSPAQSFSKRRAYSPPPSPPPPPPPSIRQQQVFPVDVASLIAALAESRNGGGDGDQERQEIDATGLLRALSLQQSR